MKKLDLLGQKFEKLTVVSAAADILSKKEGGRSYTAWNCQCECGKIIIVRTSTLKSGRQKSCGCIVSKSGLSIKSGDIFNKLTAMSYENGFWTCLCECGNKTCVLTSHLISGNTKSCGCLKSEKVKNNIQKAIKKQTKYSPIIASARRCWKSYLYQDKQCDLTFEQWYDLSQQNCFYCGNFPSNTHNCFEKKKDASIFAKENGNFLFNGLDKVNSSKSHTLDNVVPCCWICNRAKSERTQQEFYNYINTLKINDKINIENILILPTANYILVSIKLAYKQYIKNYGTMEIDLQTFYTYSQLPCHYCGIEKSNYFNVYLKDKKASQTAKDGAHFYYNGIDRLDNNLRHTVDNIVPCCCWCNFAKGKLILSDFQEWIQRIQTYQKQKSVDITSTL